jgi:hypothetical protein
MSLVYRIALQWSAIKCILRYVRHSVDSGLQLRPFSSTLLSAFSDADWTGTMDDRQSMGGMLYFMDEI